MLMNDMLQFTPYDWITIRGCWNECMSIWGLSALRKYLQQYLRAQTLSALMARQFNQVARCFKENQDV